jgi:pyruvate dehydrogenase E2 component (dihydrolipoamide acetyltransferase)
LEHKPENLVPLTNIQKIIAKRMLHSKQHKPCFYMSAKADVTELLNIRPQLRKTLGVKVTTNTFYILAMAIAGKKSPLIAGKINGDSVQILDCVNVGFAVSAPHGLVVPVIKNAQNLSLAQTAKQEKLLTDKARNNTLSLEELENENIAISNLGGSGTDSFIAIVPPQASTILSVGNPQDVIIPSENCFKPAKMLELNIAVDARIMSPFYVAEFLTYVKNLLEQPQTLISYTP